MLREHDLPPEPNIRPLWLAIIAIGLGILAGFGAVLFRALIGLANNVIFLGHFSLTVDANAFSEPSQWGPLIIVVPALGGLVVTFLITTFAPETRGHGVPEVIGAIYYREGRIRPIVAAVKSLASAFSIGSGASVGREGPIIQIGASLGSTLGQLIPMATWQRITLVAAGAGAGIAATFNTPIGGVMFAIELMLPEVSVRTFLPVALATGTATFIARVMLGLAPAFNAPPLPALSYDRGSLITLVLYAVLGAITGLAATAFIKGLHRSEQLFDRIPNPYMRHVAGMLPLGLMIYVLGRTTGHYLVNGVGYSTIQAVLAGAYNVFPFLLLLYFCKLAATLLSLGSGSSGGIFSPSLYMGSVLGAGFGAFVNFVAPTFEVNIVPFAMVGMAAMVGGGTGAVMTAVTMIFEMTRDYDIVLPMIVAVAISTGVRWLLSRDTIYTIKLLARRHFVPMGLHANMFLVRHACDVMDRDVAVLPAGTSFAEIMNHPEQEGQFRHLVAVRDGRIVGVQRVNVLLRRGFEANVAKITLGDIVRPNFTIAREDDAMFDVIRRMWRRDAAMAVVVNARGVPRAENIVGIITKEHIADSVAHSVGPN